MKENFEQSLKKTLQWEGGYSDDAGDPGGKTQWGITWREYNLYRRRKGWHLRSVRLLTRNEMHEIYKMNYWDKMNCDALPFGVDFAIFDLAVNNGVRRAQQFLNFSRRHLLEGSPEDFIDSICNQRLAYDRRLRIWPRFGHGWTTRISGVRWQAKHMIKHE